MSSLAIPTPETQPVGSVAQPGRPRSLGVELRKNFITKRGFWIYLLALAPAAVIWLHSIVTLRRGGASHITLAKDTEILAGIFQIFFFVRRCTSAALESSRICSAVK